jgi:hypothetical protein
VTLVALLCFSPLPERSPVPAAQAQPVYSSDLWGQAGEHWAPSSRLPDFSFAGYQAGNTAIPLVPVTTNVKDFGATGDGTTDDTQAFQRAIAATEHGTLFVPAGRYKITDRLKITNSNFVLRGAGEGHTVLFFAPPLGAILERAPDGGQALLTVRGEQQGKKLATVVGAAERGEYTLQLSSTAGIAPGQMIRLRMTNPPDNSLGCALYANQGCLNAQRQQWAHGEIVDWAVEVQEVRGNTITLVRPLRLDVRREWEPSIWQHRPSVQEVGIEQLTIAFPNAQYEGHGTGAGYYAIVLSQVFNAWIRQVTIVDADRGIEIVRGGYNTIAHVTLATNWRQAAANPTGEGTTGHYGFHLHALTQDNLVTESEIQTTFDHNMAVATFANGNVYSGMLSQSGRLDYHGAAPYENLYTELVLTEDAGDLLQSGGNNGDEPNAGARSTLWNIVWLRGAAPKSLRLHDFPQINIIGLDQWATKKTTDQAWIERWPGSLTSPANLYHAQLSHRKGKEDDTFTPSSVAAGASGGEAVAADIASTSQSILLHANAINNSVTHRGESSQETDVASQRVLLPAAAVTGTSYYVSPSGAGTTCTPAAPCALATGRGKAGAGDEVVLLNGVYTNGTLWTRRAGVTFRAQNTHKAILRSRGGAVVRVVHDNTTVRGLRLDGERKNVPLLIQHPDHAVADIIIERCILENSSHSGIGIGGSKGASNITVRHNLIQSTGWRSYGEGIYIGTASQALTNKPVSAHIYGNTFRGFTLNGIDLKSNSRNVEIHHNIFEEQVPATPYRPGSQLATRANEGTISSKGTGHRIANNIIRHLVDAGLSIFRTSEDGSHRIVDNVILGVDKTSFAITVTDQRFGGAPTEVTNNTFCDLPTYKVHKSTHAIVIHDNPGIPGGAPQAQCNAEITRILAEMENLPARFTAGSVKRWIAAEAGKSLKQPMVVGTDSRALGGKYIWVPEGDGNIWNPASTGGEALYSFTVPVAGIYTVWGRILVSGGDSFYVRMDNSPPLLWTTTRHGKGTWVWDQIHKGTAAPARFTLTAGTHTFRLKQREDGTKLDHLLITNDLSYTPN